MYLIVAYIIGMIMTEFLVFTKMLTKENFSEPHFKKCSELFVPLILAER